MRDAVVHAAPATIEVALHVAAEENAKAPKRSELRTWG